MPLSKTLSNEEDGPEDRCVSGHALFSVSMADCVRLRSRGSRAKHLARVAAEYTQLLYHVAKAQTDGQSSFIDEIQWVCMLSGDLSGDDSPTFIAN